MEFDKNRLNKDYSEIGKIAPKCSIFLAFKRQTEKKKFLPSIKKICGMLPQQHIYTQKKVKTKEEKLKNLLQ